MIAKQAKKVKEIALYCIWIASKIDDCLVRYRSELFKILSVLACYLIDACGLLTEGAEEIVAPDKKAIDQHASMISFYQIFQDSWKTLNLQAYHE